MKDDLLFCPLRKTFLANLPEEKIRQALIRKMIQQLGFPPENLVVEKKISQLPHIEQSISVPNRRTDLIVFAKNIHPSHSLYPLLLIECKSIPLTDKVLRQIIGYNQFIKAHFIAVVNQTHEVCGWFDPKKQDFCFQEGIPSYSSLLDLF